MRGVGMLWRGLRRRTRSERALAFGLRDVDAAGCGCAARQMPKSVAKVTKCALPGS
jgi:hypothetical protein